MAIFSSSAKKKDQAFFQQESCKKLCLPFFFNFILAAFPFCENPEAKVFKEK